MRQYPTILVVDDDAELRSALFDTLTDEGYAVLCASNAIEALGVVDSLPVDLVILDLRMPGMPVEQFVERLGQAECPPLVIVLSGSKHAPVFPCTQFLRKPVSRPVLLRCIEDLGVKPVREFDLHANAGE